MHSLTQKAGERNMNKMTMLFDTDSRVYAVCLFGGRRLLRAFAGGVASCACEVR